MDKMNLLGYDIGGTKCAVVLGSTAGEDVEILGRQVVATGGREPDAVLTDMARMARGLLSKAGKSARDIAGLGISCGGPLDSASGWVLNPPNLPDWNLNLVERVQRDLGVSTRLENDANAGAVAEHRWGAGKGSRNMVFLTMGTGMGAGIVINGELYSGTNDLAGEVGHIRLAADGPVGYGKRGSFEGFCSGGGIALAGRAAAEAARRSGKATSLPEIPEAIDARAVCEAARAGDAVAAAVIREAGERLGQGLALLMDILNPQIIAIGGIFPRARDLIWPHAERILFAEALPGALAVGNVVPAALGEQIGDLSALAIALLAAHNSTKGSER